MKMFFKYILLMLVSIPGLITRSFAQDINPGQLMPSIELCDVINYSSGSIHLSDFKGKLLIFDFWGTGCHSCIEAFPEMDALQKQFKGKIQIIAVNKQSKDSTLSFFKKRTKIKLPGLPFATGDALLNKLFPHIYVPHHVWVDSTGIVRYITAGYNTTAENITKFLEGKNPQLLQKSDIMDFDGDKPLLVEGNGRWLPKAKYFSYILKAAPAVQAGGMRLPNHITISSSIEELFKEAFSENGKYDFRVKNKVLMQVKDRYAYELPARSADFDLWAQSNFYYYELMLPVESQDQLYLVMQQDLTRFFNLEVSVQKRKIKCLVLSGKFKPDPKDDECKESETEAEFSDLSLDEFIGILNEMFHYARVPTPAINNAGSIGKIKIRLKKEILNPLNLEGLKQELRSYGLYLVEKDWITDVLVIKEK